MWQPVKIKETLALITLAICVYTDIKDRYIYVMPLVISGAGGILISLISALCFSDGSVLIYDIVLPVAAGAALVAASHVREDHIGAGDGILVAAVGLLVGIRTDVFSLLAGLAVVPLYAAVKRLTGKKRFVRSVPFAPFMMTGYMFVLINEL